MAQRSFDSTRDSAHGRTGNVGALGAAAAAGEIPGERPDPDPLAAVTPPVPGMLLLRHFDVDGATVHRLQFE